MSTSLEYKSKIDILKDRAAMLARVRAFFAERGVMEVDTPLLSKTAPIDRHIDVMRVEGQGFLHTSPEYGMKRLLALGIGDIYQLSHVYREGEVSPLHNPEFTMIEWYRTSPDFTALQRETLAVVALFLGEVPQQTYRYRDLFRKHLDLDSTAAPVAELLAAAQRHGMTLSPEASSWDRDTLLQLLMSFVIEPLLGQDELSVVVDFPGSQSALARTEQRGDEWIAKRFEVYFRGIELANGYHELTDANEQRRRFEEANEHRRAAGKPVLPLDEDFLAALASGLPDCCGVAVGFDRLMMLRHSVSHIGTILSFLA